MTVLYRKYRPAKLADLLGQEHIKETLLKQLSTGKFPHAFLFSGPRGIGKTSTARILAKAINCQRIEKNQKNSDLKFGEPCNECETCLAINEARHLDLLEIDAASNRGIDEIRDLREKIKLAPSGSRFKVYIIDEAHMLTAEAFNALLKTLEEPPPHAVFILATTEPHKIPATILSRTSRFDFKRPSPVEIKQKLAYIANKEGWDFSDEVLSELARTADGAYRDAEVLLEKVASVNKKAAIEEVQKILGKVDRSEVDRLLTHIIAQNSRNAFVGIDNFIKSGGNVRVLNEMLLEILRKLLLIKAGVGEQLVAPGDVESFEKLSEWTASLSKEKILKLIQAFSESLERLRTSIIPSLPLEIAIVEVCEEDRVEDLSNVGRSSEDAEQEATLEVQKQTPRDEEKEESEVKIIEVEEKKTASDSAILKKIQKGWLALLKEVKPLNASLEVFLRNAKPVDLDEDLLTIEFGYRFHKERIEDLKNRSIIEDLIKKLFGISARIKGTVGQKPIRVEKEQNKEETQRDETDPAEIFGKFEG